MEVKAVERPEMLYTITVGQTRQKYRDNVKALDNICLLVSTGSLEEVKEIAGESRSLGPLAQLVRADGS